MGLKAKEAGVPNLRVEYSEITFEHELARSAAMLSLMLDAFETLHPIKGAKLRTDVTGLATDDEKANAFLAEFLQSNTSKGVFAQELAALLETTTPQLSADTVPDYIQRALRFLDVISPNESDEQPGNIAGTNPGSKAN